MARRPRGSTGPPSLAAVRWSSARLVAGSDAAPLIVLDSDGAPDIESLDAAVRATASLCVHLARSGGCAILLPGERRPTLLDGRLRRWPAVHAALALVEPGRMAPRGRGLREGSLRPLGQRRCSLGGGAIAGPDRRRRAGSWSARSIAGAGSSRSPGAPRPRRARGERSGWRREDARRRSRAVGAGARAIRCHRRLHARHLVAVARPGADRQGGLAAGDRGSLRRGSPRTARAGCRNGLARGGRGGSCSRRRRSPACSPAGVDAFLLKPANWGALGDLTSVALRDAGLVDLPYDQADPWVRTVFLILPAGLLLLSALLCFHPGRRGRGRGGGSRR